MMGFGITRRQATTLIGLLTEIRDALVSPTPVADAGCPHPEEARVDLSGLSETRWICRRCRYEHIARRPVTAGP